MPQQQCHERRSTTQTCLIIIDLAQSSIHMQKFIVVFQICSMFRTSRVVPLATQTWPKICSRRVSATNFLRRPQGSAWSALHRSHGQYLEFIVTIPDVCCYPMLINDGVLAFVAFFHLPRNGLWSEQIAEWSWDARHNRNFFFFEVQLSYTCRVTHCYIKISRKTRRAYKSSW